MDPAYSEKAQPSFLKTYLRLLSAVRPYWGQLALAILCMIVLAGTTGVYAYLVGPMLKFLATGGRDGGRDVLDFVPGLKPDAMEADSLLMVLPLLILIVAAVKGVSYFGQFYLMGRVGQRVVADLRESMFRKLTALSPNFFDRSATGQIISRFTNDVYAVEQAVTYAVAAYLRDSLQVIVLSILAFVLDWRLAFIAFVVMPVAVFPIVHFGKRLKRVSTDSQVSLGELADRLHETIKGMRIVQVFGAEGHEQARFGQENRRYLRIMLRSFAVRALQSPVMEFLGAAGLAATIWYAGSRVLEGSLDPGHFISFFAAVMMLYNPIKSLGRIGGVTAAGVAGAERVFELLDEQPGIAETPEAVELAAFGQALRFEQVHFAYPKPGDGLPKEVLKGVSFEAERGQVVAVVGPSGAGKSTLINLVPRFHDPLSGGVLIDGVDIRKLRLASLRAQVAMVTQETILFNDTVEANITYGRAGVDEARLREVAAQAHALEFIEAMPEGFSTLIGEGGIRLSGGQRQRIAIARALMKDAPILLLDEATSALDTESEREVQQALDALMRNRTTLVIAHRLSTIYRADHIIVFDEGRVVETGDHETLLAGGGLYRKLYDMQFLSEAGKGEAGP